MAPLDQVKRERLQSRRDLSPLALPQALDFFRSIFPIKFGGVASP
jgi:hypothetical protein